MNFTDELESFIEYSISKVTRILQYAMEEDNSKKKVRYA